MGDKSKSKALLIEEVSQLRQRVAELEKIASSVSPIERDINQAIIETSPAFFVVIDSKGRTKMMNRSMLAALGYLEEEVQGKEYLSTFVPERERDTLSKVFQEELLQGKSTKSQNHLITKNGQEIFVEWRGRPMMDQNSEVEAYFGIGLDITERYKSEEMLQRISEDEIKRREELEKLREISTSLRQAEGSSSLLQVFTREVQEFSQADVISSVLFKAPNELVTSFSMKMESELNPGHLEEIHNALLAAESGMLSARVSGFESVLVLPLRSADMMHGAVMLASRSGNKLKADEKNMLNAIADMAGTALHRIDILETLEERVQRRTHDLVVLYNLITIISENWRLQDILELSLVLTLETVKANRGIIYLSDGKETPGLKPVIQRGFADGFQVEADSLPQFEWAQEVFTHQKALTLDNLADHPDHAGFNELNSYAGIPIFARGEVRGVFSLFANKKGIFGPDEMALLASIVDHLGIGIENSILWEQSRENAALEERHRLARNLHDSVSQLLYSLTLMAGSTKKMLERDTDLDIIKNSVTRLGETAHQALKEMRLLLYELRPAVIDSEGLVSALQHRIETVEERLGLKVNLQSHGVPDLPANMEDALYHIALEALNNIIKHAETATASIRITSANGSIEMEISDDGKGFDMNQLHKGLGLVNIRERVQMLGGDLFIDSSLENGTRILTRFKIPFHSLIES